MTTIIPAVLIFIGLVSNSGSSSSRTIENYETFLRNMDSIEIEDFPTINIEWNDKNNIYPESPIFRINDHLALYVHHGIIFCTFNPTKNWKLNIEKKKYPSVTNAFKKITSGHWTPIIFDDVLSVNVDRGEVQYLKSDGVFKHFTLYSSFDSKKDGVFKIDKLYFCPWGSILYNGFSGDDMIDWGFSRRFWYGELSIFSKLYKESDVGYGRGIKMSYLMKNDGKRLEFHDVATNYITSPFSKIPFDIKFSINIPNETDVSIIGLSGYYNCCMLMLLCSRFERKNEKISKTYGFYTCAIDTDFLDYTPYWRHPRFTSSVPGNNSEMVWLWHELPSDIENLSCSFRIESNDYMEPNGNMKMIIFNNDHSGYWIKKIGHSVGLNYTGPSNVKKWEYVVVVGVGGVLKEIHKETTLKNFIERREGCLSGEAKFSTKDYRGVMMGEGRKEGVILKNWGPEIYVSELIFDGRRMFIFKHIKLRPSTFKDTKFMFFAVAEGVELENNFEISVFEGEGVIEFDLGARRFLFQK